MKWTLLLLLAGCGGPAIQYMKPTIPPASLQAPPNEGLVVFVQPSHWAGAFAWGLLDEEGRYLGRPQAATHFAVPSPPGRHMFVVWAENTDAVEVEVAPGKTYFVEVGASPGFFSPSFHLYAITPRNPTWQKREEWLQSTTQMARDLTAPDPTMQEPKEARERVRRGREWLAKYRGTQEETRHFINASEGL